MRRRQRQQRRRLLVDLHDRARLRLPADQGALRARLRRRHPDRQRAVRSGDRGRANGVLDARAAGIRAGPARAARSASATPPSAATARRKAPRAATTATPCRTTAARRPARPSRRARARTAPARASAATASCCRARSATTATTCRATAARRPASRRVRVHVQAAAARRQHPGAGRLPRLRSPTHIRLRAGRAPVRTTPITGLVDTMLDADGQAGVRRHGRTGLHHQRGDVRASGTRDVAGRQPHDRDRR